MMAKRREQRYQSAGAAAEALAAVLRELAPAVEAAEGIQEARAVPTARLLPGSVPRADLPPGRPPIRKRRRRPRLLAGGAVVLGLAVLFVAVALNREDRPDDTRPADNTGEVPPDRTPAEGDVAAALAKLVARGADPQTDRERLWQEVVDFRAAHPGNPEALEAAGLLGRLPSPLDRLDPKLIPAHDLYPDWQPKGLAAVIGEHFGRLWGQAQNVAFSPNGKLLATVGADGLTCVWDADAVRLRPHTSNLGGGTAWQSPRTAVPFCSPPARTAGGRFGSTGGRRTSLKRSPPSRARGPSSGRSPSMRTASSWRRQGKRTPSRSGM
jgi:hypothetical protein